MPKSIDYRSPFELWMKYNEHNIGASDFVVAAVEVNDTMEVAKKILQGQTSKDTEPSMGLIVEVCKMIFDRERVNSSDRQPVDE